MILLAGFYQDPDPSRRAELGVCLQRNLENGCIDEVHLMVEEPGELARLTATNPLLAAPKVRLVPHRRRVTYRDLFDYANSQLAGQRVILANADIYFDRTLAYLDGFELGGKLLCLSRWDVQPDGSARFFEHPSSQDAWIFQAPIPAFACDFHLGQLGCDNRLAWEADHAGLAVSNPSRTLRAYHLHLSQVRRYSARQRLSGPTQAVPAITLDIPWPTCGPAPSASCAVVAFREQMGYTVARLAADVSSHNNDRRPFRAIPPQLAGLAFTQVVASSVSPVEVEFLSAGKLYVLVGNDWAGSQTATEWLCRTGFWEGLPLVETRCGTGFVAWSLLGQAGARFEVPTQVMLAAQELVRR